jgi:AraC-like DNA-binding protein
VDVLADVLSATKLGGTVTADVRAAGPWGIAFPDLPTASFHHVVEGSCWLRRPGAEPVPLSSGDLVLLAAGTGHALAGAPAGPTTAFDQLAARESHGPGVRGGSVRLDLPGPGPHARLICGGYHVDGDVSHPLLSLPPLLLLRCDAAPWPGGLSQTLAMLATELADPTPGTATIADRLVDVLFVHILRCWAAREDTEGGRVWLAALADPPIAAAVTAIHRAPQLPWTVDALADQAGVSRATLSRRFTRLVGQPPLTYLTAWRMQIAARRLRETSEPVSGIATAVGYTSEFAFSRVFKRHRGLPPSRYRSAHRTGHALEP